MEDLKLVGGILGVVFCFLAFIGGIVGVVNYISEKSEDAKLARSIQCKQIGGQFTYENYSWICK